MKQFLLKYFWSRYKTTPHPDYGIVLYHRKRIWSEWEKVFTYNSKHGAIEGIEKHRKDKSEIEFY